MPKINVKHIAKLASLPLTDAEEKKFEGQLEAVLGHIEKLSEVDVTEVEETSQVTGLKDVDRNDEVSPSLSQKEAVSQSPMQYNGLFEVPVIIEEAIE